MTTSTSIFSRNLLFCMLIAGSTFPGTADTIVSSVDTYIRSGNPENELENEFRMLVGYLSNSNFLNNRGLVQFDLSAYTGTTIESVTLSLTGGTGTATDQQAAPYADILLKDLGENFNETTVNWNNLTPAGGDVSGSTLSTITGYDVYDGGDLVNGDTFTFASTPGFIGAAQNAIENNGGIFSLIMYAPDYENGSANNFYRFAENGTLNISAIPEPGTLVLLGIAMGTILLFHRRR
ncbi:MAG: DNRLRE domain-containing protein [Kiritimatiellae bacterium]|jgi:hypothetical protein|nr:DNRLRE domain-containing protein [Kiritimatiellia bacterium]